MSDNVVSSLSPVKAVIPNIEFKAIEKDSSPNRSMPNYLKDTTNLSVKTKSPIPGYEVFERLGQGGMGIVYRGRQINMDRIVAIKVLRSQFSAQPKIVEKFLKEAKTLASLNHNNIIKVITLGQHLNRNYFVMEFVSGPTLLEKLNQERVLKESDVLQVSLQIAEAISHLNQYGIVHRDIKPSNIILNAQNIPKLSDFGISITQTSSESSPSGLSGTCHYISPEQALQKDVDVRSDFYSLGATMFHLLTGQTPFAGDKSYVIITKLLTEELANPNKLNSSLSRGVSKLVQKMMAKDPLERFQTPIELITAIKTVISSGELPNVRDSKKSTRRTRSLKSFSRRN